MSKLKLYNVLDKYVDYLRQFDKKVFSTKEEDRKHKRKYLGTVLKIHGMDYFVPLSSPKDSDYISRNGMREIRKSIIPIIRIIVKDDNGNDELKGTLKFSNMIPVPYIALINYDVNNEMDLGYKILILKELSFIRKNVNKIIKNASIIYNQKINNYDINYLNDTVDFKLLEQKCMEYITMQEVAVTKEE